MTWWFVYEWGKPNGKTPQGDFQVTTPETPLLSHQAITSKGISSTLPTYSRTLTPIPNWTCSVVTVHPHDEDQEDTWSQNPMVHIHSNFFKRKRWSRARTSSLVQELRLWSQFSWTKFTQCLCNLWTFWRPLKQSFYMSRVRKRKGLKTHSWIPRKSSQNSEILKPW